jgi:hypothetical protein
MKSTPLYLLILATIAASVLGFSPTNSNNRPRFGFRSGHASCNMITIAEGVHFDTIAREWRCKWSPDGDKVSLVAAQKALEAVIDDVKKVPGVKKVDRVVCGGCLDFKVCFSPFPFPLGFDYGINRVLSYVCCILLRPFFFILVSNRSLRR